MFRLPRLAATAPVLLAASLATAFVLPGSLVAPALAQGQKPTPQMLPKTGDPVVAKVNGVDIRRSEVLLTIEALPEQYRGVPPDALFVPVLERMIDGKILAQAAEKAKVADDPAVKKRLAATRERVLQDVYLTREVEKGLTDAKLRAEYDKSVKNQPPVEEVKARHILVKTEAEAKAAIEEVNKGADFAEVSKKRSTGPSANNGGDLGYFTKDQMVPEFANAAFALKKGEVTKTPVQTQFGWHVIKVEDRRAAPAPTFEEKREEIRTGLAEAAVQTVIGDLRKSAKVEQMVEAPPASPHGGAMPQGNAPHSMPAPAPAK